MYFVKTDYIIHVFSYVSTDDAYYMHSLYV